MNRRKLLTLAGATLLSKVTLAQNVGLQTGNLQLSDAPIRTVLELVMKGFGQNNYTINNNVVGFVTLSAAGLSFEKILNIVCPASSYPVEYTRANNVFIFRPVPGLTKGPAIPSHILRQAQLPLTEGIPCRMAGYLLGRATPYAIFEVGTPPESEISIVMPGSEVKLGKETYTVEKITWENLTLVGNGKQLTVPLAPLIPKKR